jgi:hypothetical protein
MAAIPSHLDAAVDVSEREVLDGKISSGTKSNSGSRRAVC